MSLTIRILLILGAVLAGLLAGADIDRAFVAMPAWQQLGATPWAEFSRHADLGNGLVLYPLEAFGSTALILAAAVRLHFDRTAPRTARLFLYASAVLALSGLALTLKAAPIMLSVARLSDPGALQDAFLGFSYWGNWRAVCQVLAFLALLVALAALMPKRR